MRNNKDYAKINLLKEFIEHKINGNCEINDDYEEGQEKFTISIEFWCSNGKDCYWNWEERNTDNKKITDVFEKIFNQIYKSYENYDVDEEAEINLQCNERPTISQIVEDCKEEEETLSNLTLDYSNTIKNIDSAVEKILV